MNNSKLSLLNHCPAVIWNSSYYQLSGRLWWGVLEWGSLWVFSCALQEFISVWSEDRVLIFHTVTGQSIPRHKAHHVVSRFQWNTWSRSENEGKAAQDLNQRTVMRTCKCTVTNSCGKLRFGLYGHRRESADFTGIVPYTIINKTQKGVCKSLLPHSCPWAHHQEGTGRCW